MPPHKITTKQWQAFSKQINFSRQTIDQLSKLYIVIHQKVKSSIKKSLIDPSSNFSEQAKHHIQFIKNVLSKIKQTQNDQYLVQIEMNVLKKYEKNLLDLLNQIQLMLKVQESKLGINIQELKRIKPQKRSKYDLKDQLFLSTKRMERTKSGKKVIKNKDQQKSNQLQEDNINQLFPTLAFQKEDENQIQNQQKFILKLFQKQNKLKNSLFNTMSKTQNGLGVSFAKKYQQNNLQKYLRQKKQFTDLLFNQQLYNKIINKRQAQNNPTAKNYDQESFQNNLLLKKGIKIDQLNNKIFPQFQIKTKFMKSEVKKKVSSVITDIKKQLLLQYFNTNSQILKEANKDEQKSQQLKRSKSLASTKKHQDQNLLTQRTDKYKTLRQSTSVYPQYKASLSQRRNLQLAQIDQKDIAKINKRKSYSSLNKNQILGKFSKSSLSKTKITPFYRTEDWNQRTEQRYTNHILSRLSQAKV